MASHVVASEGYREPTDYGDLFRILEENEVEMAGLRNVLAQEYARIDDERVYEHLQDIEHFREFACKVAAFVGMAETNRG